MSDTDNMQSYVLIVCTVGKAAGQQGADLVVEFGGEVKSYFWLCGVISARDPCTVQ